ncbi:hypothetical protein COW36_02090 [bacterium (Candidatus Blackallbacteria) CG17_big_fil_post_rev_8_21_14_2_50_48_46]|uniref:Protein kinase domain-containing protein n=1 Tax=bacterium (Candidatus Blackallbacteria) CG17_big_fil_post_rev_8_21_14_2_50_48_46 TaxID=2014261 RepID=A0A2M7GAP3_9BACT|nr:MAG: hypothetical protein COW64_26480 [bacterium (Candidatus Blackallbacteria) CG18_big_fil_WC_8_21_14_2_50_49_26]PIW19224.1 MAG: hypothetical protein COW36_02090 [bacterium (Candidatus Blackallbacteria) CG17_big_fil_post_rev_8_21_14_2_50_48_46]PIW45426.1 MAG: hypothetical protein COW20_20050 [bacterium (Candidatus Blackallbacteria) CG13_big_fil_rev_8_21_14_2_50_49_14]
MSLIVINQRFELHQELGRGGFATTWKAKDRNSGRWCTLKSLNLQNLEDWKSLELFERESKVLANLNHPNIPRFYESLTVKSEKEEKYFQVQEFIEGQSLKDSIERGRFFTEKEVIKLGSLLLEVLDYLHSFSPPIIHRDIKPGNILLSKSQTPYLIDFGAVKETLRQKQGATPTVVGTFGYMAIEQMNGDAAPASDLYSLGMTLIYLLSHREPHEIEKKGLKLNFRPHVNISGEFAKVLERMIEPDIQRRFGSAREVLKEFQKLLGRQEIKLSETPETKKQNKSVGYTIAAGALVLISAFSIWEVKSHSVKYRSATAPSSVPSYKPIGSINAKEARSLGLIYYGASSCFRANQYFDKALESFAEDAEIYFKRGICRGRLKQYALAIEDYKKAYAIAPEDYPESLYNMGWNYYQMNLYHSAIRAFTESLEVKPKHKDSLNYRGLSYIENKQYDKALADFQETIKIDSHYKYPWNNIAWVYEQQKRYPEALTAYDEAMKRFPAYSLPFYNKGDLLIKLKRYSEAIVALKGAIAASPDYASAHNLLGLSYYHLKEYDLAISHYLEAIRQSPKYATAWYNLGLVYDDQKNNPKAIEYYQKALEFNPKYTSPMNNLGYLYERQKEYTKALEYYDLAIQLEPQTPRFLNNRGDVYKALKKCTSAQADWKAACRYGNTSACKKTCP